jgi:hypothetical protein
LNDAAALARRPLAIFNCAFKPGRGAAIRSDNRAVISSIMMDKFDHLFIQTFFIFHAEEEPALSLSKGSISANSSKRFLIPWNDE